MAHHGGHGHGHGGGSGGGDKRSQWFAAIGKEKLDAVRWGVLHSGISVAVAQNDDGLTGLQLAASADKPRAMLVILDALRSRRELGEAIDVADDEGRTPLMLAAARGADKCVEHLLYYKASITAKSAAGKTARDYAVAGRHAAVVELFDDEADDDKSGPAAGGAGGGEAEVDADGLVSGQRYRLKKRAVLGEAPALGAAVGLVAVVA